MEYHAEINRASNVGETPIYLAVLHGKIEAM